MRHLRRKVAVCACLSACSCGAPSTAPVGTGTSESAGPCGRGLVVVESDYQSSNASLLGFDGSVLSPSLLSSAAQAGGFGLRLGRDVVPSSAASQSRDVVLIDRYPPILHFVDPSTALLRAELNLGTGFGSNPHDYLWLSEHKAYVSRYNSNANPGAQTWDAGGDILLVDPSVPKIVGRIDLAPAMAGERPQFTPNPGRLLQVGGRVFSLLESYSNDFLSATSSRLVELDPSTDTLLSTLVLSGLKGCGGLAQNPDQAELAVACSGADTLSIDPSIEAAGLALIDITGTPKISKRFAASTFSADPLGGSIDYVGPNRIFFGTLGHFADSGAVLAQDSLWVVDTESAVFEAIVASELKPFTLGSVRCAALCGACFATDADREGGSVLRFPLTDAGSLMAFTPIRAETQIGLPPRYLGSF